MATSDKVLDVLTVKRHDNRPRLSMTINEINQADQQPHSDASWDKYRAEEFDQATRIELHMDYNDVEGKLANAGDHVRMVDGDAATWDSQTETVSILLDREDVPVSGEYLFEWVLIYDPADATTGEVPTSDNATEVNTVPVNGLFGLDVNEPSNRSLAEIDAPPRTVGTLTLGTLQGEDGGAVRLATDIDAGTTQTVRRIREPTDPDDPARYDTIMQNNQPADPASLDGTDISPRQVTADETHITAHESDSDASVAGYTGRHFYDVVVDDDGTYYGIWHDPSDVVWDGGSTTNDFVLESTTDPTDLDSWTEVHRWTGHTNRSKVALHITATGTMLTGFDGSLWRSTDSGQSWTDVAAPLTDASTNIWSFTENATGRILASEHNAVRILESTDDGATWTEFANTADFPTFDTHVHKVKYHPVNDWLIVTGGDTLAYRGFYRSTDGGTTWQHHKRNETYVAIAPHPTNGNVYFLGSDERENAGIYRVHDDGTTIETKLIQTLDHRADPATISGAFAMATYTTTVDGDDGFLAASTVENHPRLLLRSQDMSAVKWHAVGEVGPDPMGTSPNYSGTVGAMGTTTSRGPYEQVVDTVGLRAIVHGDQYMRTQTARDSMYGTAVNNPLELRRTIGNIVFGDPDHQLYEHAFDTDTVHRMWQVNAGTVDGRHTFVARYNKSRFEFYSGTDKNRRLNIDFATPAVDAFADVRLRTDTAGNVSGLVFESRQDMRGFGSWTDEIRLHDGSGVDNTAGPAWYDNETGTVISLVDGTTIS